MIYREIDFQIQQEHLNDLRSEAARAHLVHEALQAKRIQEMEVGIIATRQLIPMEIYYRLLRWTGTWLVRTGTILQRQAMACATCPPTEAARR